MSSINLIHGDCLEEMKKIPDDVFIISDPPYNQKYHYNSYKDNLDQDEYAHMIRSVFGGRKSAFILYPEEMINICGGGKMGEVEQVVSWVYNSNTAKQSRLISWFGCKPDFRKVPQPYKNPTDKRIAKRIAEGKSARGYDWWKVNQVKNVSKSDNPHPCPVPIELMEKIILATTNEGDTICDPFMGSGTTGVAAKRLNRNFIGIELDEEYYKIAEKRINKEPQNESKFKKCTRRNKLYYKLPCSVCGEEIKMGEVYYHKNSTVNYHEGCKYQESTAPERRD